MKLYLLKIWGLTSLISCLAEMLLIFVMLSMETIDNNVRHCDMSALLYPIGIIYYTILSIGIIPIFINLNKRIRNNFYYSLASFFLIPTLIVLVLEPLSYDIRTVGVLYILSIPFFITLTSFFWIFRKSRFVNKKEAA